MFFLKACNYRGAARIASKDGNKKNAFNDVALNIACHEVPIRNASKTIL
jgi:hypothetical protein